MDVEKLTERVRKLVLSGLHCSQIVLLLSQELRGEDEPEVIRAMGGLAGGLSMGLNCGSLSGGCCMLSSYVARGGEDDEDSRPYKPMVIRLVDWFNTRFGNVNCSQLVAADRAARLEFCPRLIAETFAECVKILEENGIDPRA
jgi:hypothetical protein